MQTVSRTRRVLVSLAAALLAVAAGGCGASSEEASNSSDITAVESLPTVAAGSVAMTEWAFVFPGGESVGSYPAGPVELNVVNRGTIEHQLLVVRTDLDRFSLPLQPDGLLDETGAGVSVISRSVLAPENSLRFSDNLPAGSYLFVCNLDGHLAKGMIATVQVG